MKTGPNPKCMTDLRCRPALWVNLMALAYHSRQPRGQVCDIEVGTFQMIRDGLKQLGIKPNTDD